MPVTVIGLGLMIESRDVQRAGYCEARRPAIFFSKEHLEQLSRLEKLWLFNVFIHGMRARAAHTGSRCSSSCHGPGDSFKLGLLNLLAVELYLRESGRLTHPP